MRLTSFAVKGILAYQNSEARVNAADLPGGLIALTGPNGHGKTTLLETPLTAAFRSFPSRPDRQGRTLVDYAFTSDAYLENTFELEGRGEFRIRVNVDGPKRKSSAVLEFLNPDGSSTPLSDGKVTTFDAAIAKILPPPELLLASVFGSQTQRGSFVSLDMPARKQLFAMLLGLRHLEEMADRAKKAEKLAAQALVPLRAAREVLARDARPAIADELAQLANQLQVEGGEIELRRQQLQQDLTAAETQLAALQTAAADYASARTKAGVLEVEQASTSREQAAVRAAIDELVVTAAAERSESQRATAGALELADIRIAATDPHQAALVRIDTDLAAAVDLLTRKIAKNQELLANADQVAAAVAATTTATEQAANLRVQLQGLVDTLDGLRRRERVLSDALSAIDAADRDLARATADAALLTSAPFGDGCAPCGFMSNALAAKSSIPGLRERCETRPAADEELASVLRSITAHEQNIAAVRGAIQHHETAIEAQRSWIAFVEPLRLAKERIAEYQGQITQQQDEAERQRSLEREREGRRVAELQTARSERQRQGQEQLTALERRVEAKGEELGQRAARLTQRLLELDTELASLTTEMARTKDAADQAAAQTTLLQQRRREWDTSTGQLASVTSRREELARRREQFAARQVELEETSARIASIEQHRQDWDALSRACSRDGLQTIEIDEAGPTVSAYTNRILRDCYGTRFTVEIVTQEAKAAKGKDGSTMKETFELKVYDADRGGPARDIADLSGGEKVIVEEALKSAIALFVNDRNVHPIRTCWRDETTGPLDDDNRARYIAMLRSVHEIGGFAQTYFVTHDIDAATQADAQLYVHDGQVEVLLPPYGAAA